MSSVSRRRLTSPMYHTASGRIHKTASMPTRPHFRIRKKSKFTHLACRHILHTLRKCRTPLSKISRSALLRHIEEQMEELLDLKREIEDEEAVDEITGLLNDLKGPDDGVGSVFADVLEGLMDASLEEGEDEDGALPPFPDDEVGLDEDDDIDEDGGLLDPYKDTLTAAAMETEWGPEGDDDLDAAWFPLPDEREFDEDGGDLDEQDDEKDNSGVEQDLLDI